MNDKKGAYKLIHYIIVNKYGALFEQNNYNPYLYVIFSDLNALFPLLYFMQNHEEWFQDYFGNI